MQTGFTILDHPADLGIEAYGLTLEQAFEQSAYGLISVILDAASVDVEETREVELHGTDQGQLLVKWLSEILYLYDGKKFVAKEFTLLSLTGTDLKASVRGETFSQQKHQTRLDVKAVTYHQLTVRLDKQGGYVKVFLDI